MPARIVTVADAVKDRINDNLDPALSATVARVFHVDIDSKDLSGRQVYVFPAGYMDVEPATRSDDLKEFRIGIVIVERYTASEFPTDSWMEERLEWVQNNVFDRLVDPRVGVLLDCLWPDTATVLAWDYDLLVEKKLFFSEVEINYREEE